MTSVILPPDSTGTDTASNRLDYQKSHDAGHAFDSLYVGGDFGATRAMVEAVWRAGNVVQLNFEREDNEAAFAAGYSKGRQYSILAIDQSRELGWQGESPIVFSFADFNVQDVQLMLNVHHAIPDVFEPLNLTGGAYGPPAFLRILSVQPWWPKDYILWQWMGAGDVEWWTNVKQYKRDVIGGVAVDLSRTITPVEFWSGYGPNPKDNDMELRHDSNGQVFQIDHGFRWPMTGDYFYGVLKGTLAPDWSGKVISYQVDDDAKLFAIPVGTISNPNVPTHFNISLTGEANA